jgi:hypothetical protein
MRCHWPLDFGFYGIMYRHRQLLNPHASYLESVYSYGSYERCTCSGHIVPHVHGHANSLSTSFLALHLVQGFTTASFRCSAMICCSMRTFLASSTSLLTSPKTASICSSVLPMVSGTQKNVNTNASRQKTAKNVYAPYPVFCTSGGVTRPYSLLVLQLQHTG